MPLYKCSCNTYYTLSEDATEVVGSCIEKGKPTQLVTVCPVCGEKYIAGGEPDIDFLTGENCILTFGRDFWEGDEKLPHFDNVVLEECDESQGCEFATFSLKEDKSISLKRKN